MIYLKNELGEVFAYESQVEADQFGGPDLVRMTPEQIADHLNPTPSVPAVPFKVTMRQARLALLQAGLLSQVEDAINALPEPPRTAARIEWDFSSEVFRDRDFVIMLGTTLGLDSEEMDNLFITAATL